MKKKTEDILIAFSLHEKLNYPKVKQIFQTQSSQEQQTQLKEMKRVIKQPYTKNDILRPSLESRTNDGTKKDE